MKFGVRECCDVVLRAKGTQKVGNKIFYKNEPVIYFDTLKTSSLEGAATTVYAQGGRGNSRLMSWDGERTLTWTMEDALISPIGLMILTGAGLIETSDTVSVKVHTTEQIELKAGNGGNFVLEDDGSATITLSEEPYDVVKTAGDTDDNRTANVNESKNIYDSDYIYVMRLDSNGDIATEPFIASKVATGQKTISVGLRQRVDEAGHVWNYFSSHQNATTTGKYAHTIAPLAEGDVILVDYYREVKGAGAAQEINITPDKFGGSYYLEASTLFRNEDGIDMPAEFIIPNCRIQSNFTFTMASSGDPSSFTFTMDCFPDYTRFNPTEKVLATIQVITEGTGAGNELLRLETNHHGSYVYEDKDGVVHDTRFEAVRDNEEESVLTVGQSEGQVNGVAQSASADAATIQYPAMG